MRFLFRARFYVFLNVFFYFSAFFIFKNVVKSKVWTCKNPARNTLRGCLGNDFLLILVCCVAPYCKISHLGYSTRWRALTSHNWWRHLRKHFNTCKFWHSFLSNVYKRFLLIFPTFLKDFNVFLFLSERLLHLWTMVRTRV